MTDVQRRTQHSRQEMAPTNDQIAAALREVATLLEEQAANPFRVAAYRRAADSIAGLGISLVTLLGDHGLRGIDRVPGVGPAIARAVRDFVQTGKLAILERLRGERDPEAVLRQLPQIGSRMAAKLHRDLDISSLEDFEAALNSGELADLKWLGPKRAAALKDVLAVRLSRRGVPRSGVVDDRPPVRELLDVDREYRRRAAQGDLPMIAPRRFNPDRIAWLPILHTRRGHRDYTALFSNTARAHQLGRTREWVVIYYDGDDQDHQATVVTARTGLLRGRRVVRGREEECRENQVGPRPSGRVAWSDRTKVES
jgi:hypothetical protein